MESVVFATVLERLFLLVVLGEIVVVENSKLCQSPSGGEVVVVELVETLSISVKIQAFLIRELVGFVVGTVVLSTPVTAVVLIEIVVVGNSEFGEVSVLGRFESCTS